MTSRRMLHADDARPHPRPTESDAVRGASDHNRACCCDTASGSPPSPPAPAPPLLPSPSMMGTGPKRRKWKMKA